MRAGLLALLDQGDRHVAEASPRRRVLLEQLTEPDRAGETAGAAADDEDARRRSARPRAPSARRRPRRSRTAAESPRARRRAACSRSSSVASPDELGQLGQDLLDVADHGHVGEVEDRCVRVLVDRDDRAGALHPDLVLDRAGDAARDVELRARPTCRSARPGPRTGTSRRRRRRASPRRRRRAPWRAPRRARSCPACRDRARRRRSRPRPRSTGPDASSCACSTIRASVEKSWNDAENGCDGSRRRRPPAPRTRPTGRDRCAACPSRPRRRRPCRRAPGARRRARSPSSAQVGEIPVETGAEPRRETGRDIGGEHGGGEEHGVGAGLLDERGERVDTRLRQRRARAPGRRRRRRVPPAEPATLGDARAEHDTGRVETDRRAPSRARPARPSAARPRDARERRAPSQELPLGEIGDDLVGGAAVVLDPQLIAARLRRRRARARSCESRPRRRPLRRCPRSASESVSAGFDFALMIPFSDG